MRSPDFLRSSSPGKFVWLHENFVHLFESVLVVFEGNPDGNYEREFPRHSLRGMRGGKWTELVAKVLAPADTPEVSHKGAYRALAASQCCTKARAWSYNEVTR
jgi:hypothetical protein